MAGDWFTIVLRLALYLDMATALGVAMFGLYALRNDERSSAISQRYRVFVGAAAAIGIGLSICGMMVMAKAMSGACTPCASLPASRAASWVGRP